MPPYFFQDLQAASRSSGAVTPYASHSPLSAIRPSRRAIALGLLGVAGAVLPAQAAVAAPVQPSGPTAPINASANYSFTTLDNPADPTFNQLLGINDFGVIAGYFGNGFPAATHPSKGYLVAPYSGASFTDENYPGSQQTQVTAINDWGNTVGFYASTAGANFGFLDEGGVMTSVSDPNTTSKPAINELLGLNNQGAAVGFYTDAKSNAHAYEWHRKTGVFTAIVPFGSSSATATAINDHGTVAGVYSETNGNQAGFILKGTTDMSIEFPGALDTEILGLNNEGTVVGIYRGAHNQTHGFIYSAGVYKTLDDPDAVGTTLVNGINNLGTVVGFYIDAKGNTDGFVAYPNVAGVPTP
jgi:uncharacterized membrane protein